MCGSSSSLIGVSPPSVIGRNPALTTSSKGTTTGATPPQSAPAPSSSRSTAEPEIGSEDVGERADELLLVERHRQQVDRDGTLVQPDDHDPPSTCDHADRGLRGGGSSGALVDDRRAGVDDRELLGERRRAGRRARVLAAPSVVATVNRSPSRSTAVTWVPWRAGGVDEEGSDPAGTDDDDVIVDRRASAAHRVHGDRHRLGHGRDVAGQVAAVEVDAGAGGDGGELGERAVAVAGRS